MNLLRGLLFDNLGLKLVALLLAVLVYLNVYTDRPATMILTFPIRVTDLADSLSLSGPAPAAVQAEVRGTAKQLIRLRVSEPPMKVSLAGVGIGRYERALGPEDLPLPQGVQLQVDRMVSPRTLELQVDRRVRRVLPVSGSVEGQPAGGTAWSGQFEIRPSRVTVSGPEATLQSMDTVRVAPVSIAGKRDTVQVAVEPLGLPDWCTLESEPVIVFVPIEPAVTRRFVVGVEAPRGGDGFRFSPTRVTAVVSAPRRLSGDPTAWVRAIWWTSAPLSDHVGHRVPVRNRSAVPNGVQVRFEPDSVLLQASP